MAKAKSRGFYAAMIETYPLRLFISYAHEDEEFRRELQIHLKPLERDSILKVWSDRQINPGDKWEKTIHDALETSDIIVLLISPDFLASEFIYHNELSRAMERHEVDEARVIPVFLRPCDWKSQLFRGLQGVPDDAKPITLWRNRDEAFSIVSQAIRDAAKMVCSHHSLSSKSSITQQADLENKMESYTLRNPKVIESNPHRRKKYAFNFNHKRVIQNIAIIISTIALTLIIISVVYRINWNSYSISPNLNVDSDFLYVSFQFYKEDVPGTDPVEYYTDNNLGKVTGVFDRALYLEHLHLIPGWYENDYQIRLTSTKLLPQMNEVLPTSVVVERPTVDANGLQNYIAHINARVESSPVLFFTYRNGFQGENRSSYVGKNVVYSTNYLKIIMDFSALENWKQLISNSSACLGRRNSQGILESHYIAVEWKDSGAAVVELTNLKKGDVVRIYWTWDRKNRNDPKFPNVEPKHIGCQQSPPQGS